MAQDPPLFTVFTATHDPSYLSETYHSMITQTFSSWEWVIVANRGATIPSEIQRDEKVRVLNLDPTEHFGVGKLKRIACYLAKGEFLVEVDHDDLLDQNALRVVYETAVETGADFLYSNHSNFLEQGDFQYYYEEYGWVNYRTTLNDTEVLAIRAFPITPSSLDSILYAPNHIRVWRTSVYLAIEGHDESLLVGDDYDLICRTYLSGAKFQHIDQCLYSYRVHQDGTNTHLVLNKEVQEQNTALSELYRERIITEWARREQLPMIDLGGAFNCPAGFTSVDVKGADICCDIRSGLPFEDNSVACVRACDALQYLAPCPSIHCNHGADGGPLCTVGLMNEIYRILVPGGWFISRTPSTDGRGAFQNPQYASLWNQNSFWYYTRADHAQYLHAVEARFQAKQLTQGYPSDWHEQHNMLYVYADLVALKGQREPGVSEI